MKVTVYGLGYVGLVTAVCLAETGHEVLGVDTDPKKLELLNQGEPPIHEIGLKELLAKQQQKGRLRFTLPHREAALFGEIQFIAVGTPPSATAAVDLQYIDAVAKFIGEHIEQDTIVINKSTVPVGSSERVEKIIRQHLKQNLQISVVSNPEFLREGRAIHDCLNPERIILGTKNQNAIEKLRTLYQPLINNSNAEFITMSAASAELTKYAANTFLAMKISFINEIAEIAEKLGANIQEIKAGIGSDSRINRQFLNAGCGFGGSCFPKDVTALLDMATEKNVPADLITATLKRNERQKEILFEKILAYFDGDLSNKNLALWGLAFKPDTDDIRCATSLRLIDLLLAAGAKIKAYDPMAMPAVAKLYAHHPNFKLAPDSDEAAKNADALVVVTEWQEFIDADLTSLKSALTNRVIFDGRNIYQNRNLDAAGFVYFGMGVAAKCENELIL